MRSTEYRVVETSTVTDESLARILNEESAAGWVFDGMTFVPNEASKRPKMAFVIFTREVVVDDEPAEDGEGPADDQADDQR